MALKASGVKAGLDKLRAAVYLALTSGTSPLAVLPLLQEYPGEPLTPQDTGTGDQADRPWDEPHPAETCDDSGAAGDEDGGDGDDNGKDSRDGAAGSDGSNGGEDGRGGDNDDAGDDGDEDGRGGMRRDGPGPSGPGPSGSSGLAAGFAAPFQAVINLLVPVGTGFGWSSAPGEIAGWGPLDPETTRDMMAAASRHPSTRWCITLVQADGTAVAHGCASGRHPWAPPSARDPDLRGGVRDGPGPARDGPGSARVREPDRLVPGTVDPARQAADPGEQAADFLAGLRVKLAPVARGTCGHDQCTDKYEVPRTLKHLIQARTATCAAPCCNRSAAGGDADHTVPWPEGPTCQANLGPVCRRHHRCKQDIEWLLEQPEPGTFRWTGPSGRVRTTYPTRYLL